MVQISVDGLEWPAALSSSRRRTRSWPGPHRVARPGLGQELRHFHLLGLPHGLGGRLVLIVPEPRSRLGGGCVKQGLDRRLALIVPEPRLQPRQRPVHEELLVPVKEIEGLHGLALYVAF